MNVPIGRRLQTIAEFVPLGCCLADIGSDHGYLPAWLLLQDRVSRAIAGEVNLDPALRAEQTRQEYDLMCSMEVRLGDGLQVLSPGEVDVIVVAGMGGTTIRQILERGAVALTGVSRLILQPNVAGAELRHWLVGNHFHIVDEALIVESGIIYEVIVAEPGEAPAISDLEALLGPVLVRRRPDGFERRVAAAIAERQYVLLQLSKATSSEVEVKRKRLLQEIQELEAVIV